MKRQMRGREALCIVLRGLYRQTGNFGSPDDNHFASIFLEQPYKVPIYVYGRVSGIPVGHAYANNVTWLDSTRTAVADFTNQEYQQWRVANASEGVNFIPLGPYGLGTPLGHIADEVMAHHNEGI